MSENFWSLGVVWKTLKINISKLHSLANQMSLTIFLQKKTCWWCILPGEITVTVFQKIKSQYTGSYFLDSSYSILECCPSRSLVQLVKHRFHSCICHDSQRVYLSSFYWPCTHTTVVKGKIKYTTVNCSDSKKTLE